MPDDPKPVVVTYPYREADPSISDAANQRDPSLDPQLIWRDKYKGDVTELAAEAPPVYIQEKIDPRVLIEDLRQTAKAGEPEPELTLFDTFDGLDELDSIDFYRHHANWSNRMILGDSFQVMASLAEREALRGQVQMIYIDPPYGISFGSNWQPSTRVRTVKDGSLADTSRQVEQIQAFRDTWQLGIHSYLTYLRDRLIAARDLLTQSGSCFVQIGDENVHLVRVLMDEVFGADNFCIQFAFRTKIPLRTTLVPAVYDHVLWYAFDKSRVKFRRLFKPRKVGQGSQFTWTELEDGTSRKLTGAELVDPGLAPGRKYTLTDLVSAGRTESCVFPFEFNGRTFSPYGNKSWKTNPAGMGKLIAAERVKAPASVPRYVFFEDDYPVEELNNVWSDTQGASDAQYVVQTSVKVIERCVLMSTDPGDLVLDPTCGSGTTAYVSENWGRRWVTVDTSRVALAIARQRLMSSQFPYYLLADSQPGRAQESAITGRFLPPAHTTDDIRQGFVYERVPHITLGSITNNPDIHEGMTRAQINAAIKRHAEYELLYDRPYEDKSKVRVSGPFTVESLSPHRSLAFAGAEQIAEAREFRPDTESADSSTFDQSILDNLAAAGIQNGRRKDRLEFSQIEPHPGMYVQAVGTPRSSDGGDVSSVAIAVGPQYGTVDARFIKEAAKEAIQIDGVGILAVLAFAFDPQAVNLAGQDDEIDSAGDQEFATALGERTLGRLRLLPVRMNVDLLMGEALKKTGAGNLFTVFGEPDIQIDRTGDGQVIVRLNGVDVYDPATGEVRSNDTDQIALWMIDTNYNGESFFVRHCYFTGTNDPYKRLKTALKADINEEAWSTMYSTVSRPFDPPSAGKIAVKVINDYGDEVMQVFEVE